MKKIGIYQIFLWNLFYKKENQMIWGIENWVRSDSKITLLTQNLTKEPSPC